MGYAYHALYLLLIKEVVRISSHSFSTYNPSICLPCDEHDRGTDWPNGDTLDTPIAGVTSADECCSKCEEKGVEECKAFVFIEPSGPCSHKRQLNDPKPCFECSGKDFLEERLKEKYRPVYGMDRRDGDIDRHDGVKGPNECGKLCESEPGCLAFLWRRDHHHCWLKEQLNELSECPACVLGYIPQ